MHSLQRSGRTWRSWYLLGTRGHAEQVLAAHRLQLCAADGFGSQGSPPEVPPGAALEADLELVSWNQVSDVKSDGGIIKKTLVETSDWNKPNSEAKVVLRYEATLEDGTVFEEHGEGSELHYAADEGACESTHACAAHVLSLDVHVASDILLMMKPGEQADYSLLKASKLAASEQGKLPGCGLRSPCWC